MGEESEINLCSNQEKSYSKIYEINIQDKIYNPLNIFQNYQLRKYIKIILKS